eukprot:TRINITY_DN64846_c0_g1_i1.p1 TRINITY_DN64846_c0_g1~~TRINITY_DN64846_c0_g1_i1.p1  ORF type:complete len:216 (-),score=42.25 TRINITY_DN64846_c0_g1_i1:277-924(-)
MVCVLFVATMLVKCLGVVALADENKTKSFDAANTSNASTPGLPLSLESKSATNASDMVLNGSNSTDPPVGTAYAGALLNLRGCPGCQQCAAEAQQCRPYSWMIWVRALPCCGGMECKNLLGGSAKVCVKHQQQQCVQVHGTCGGPGQQTQPCCGNVECTNLLGGSAKVCVSKQSQCVQSGGICGGPGQRRQSCCGNMECQTLLGGSKMQCVAKHR